jgi:energy-coupling factor transport system permease protein
MAALAPRVAATGWAVYWLPRSLHPLAWWLWALGLAVAASRTTNPLLLGAIVGVVCWVVMARRSDAPWANAFRLYVIAGLIVIALRILFRVVFGGGLPGTVLVSLPGFSLGGGDAAVHVLGDITAEALLGAFYDGLRLATMLVCVGGANALANPKRLLRTMPPALHEVSTAVVVALSVFPQLAESVVRVTRARRLRAGDQRRGIRSLGQLLVPILEDALDRSMLLAASMDSRGYGRSGGRSRAASRASGALLVLGLCGISVGVYAVLDGTAPRALAAPTLLAGVAAGVVGIALSARGASRSTYRPDRWRLAELLVAGSGVTGAVVVYMSARVDPSDLVPSLSPLAWPQLATAPLIGILVGLLPAFVTPVPVAVDAGADVEAVDVVNAVKARA